MLAPAVPGQGFEPVCRRGAQVAKIAGLVQHVELAQRLLFDTIECLTKSPIQRLSVARSRNDLIIGT